MVATENFMAVEEERGWTRRGWIVGAMSCSTEDSGGTGPVFYTPAKALILENIPRETWLAIGDVPPNADFHPPKAPCAAVFSPHGHICRAEYGMKHICRHCCGAELPLRPLVSQGGLAVLSSDSVFRRVVSTGRVASMVRGYSTLIRQRNYDHFMNIDTVRPQTEFASRSRTDVHPYSTPIRAQLPPVC